MATPHAASVRTFVYDRKIFRVLSYNVLAEIFEKCHGYCPAPYLSWQHRSKQILDEVVRLKPDVVSLQEIQSSVYEQQVKPFFRPLGYESFYCGRGRPEEADYGCVLLFNSARLTCTACRTVRFRDVLDEWWPPAPTKSGEFWDKLLECDDGAVVAMLHSEEVDRSICAVATHLHWNPGHPDVKAAQAAVMCHVAAKFMRDKAPPGRPPAVLIAGDFNSLWRKYKPDAYDRVVPKPCMTSGVYELLSLGQLQRTHPDHPFTRRADNSAAQAPFTSGGLMLRSLHLELLGCEPPVTNRTDSFAGCLDYVFFSPTDWQPLSHLHMPYDYEVENDAATRDPMRAVALPPLPNRQFPSDHLPIGGDLLLL